MIGLREQQSVGGLMMDANGLRCSGRLSDEPKHQ
jgi:hypothetical protein